MSRNQPRTKRVFLATYGDGPWLCRLCDELIYRLNRTDGHLHHKNGDYEDDSPENIEVLHAVCHMRHHMAGVPKTPEHRAKTGRKGRVFTPEWRAKLSEKQRSRVTCGIDDCEYTSSPQHVGMHKKQCH